MENLGPERHFFTPTERYIENTNFVIDEIFLFMRNTGENLDVLNESVEHRTWIAGDTVFYILRIADPEAIAPSERDGSMVKMLTLLKREDEEIRSRTYSYSRNTGELQVFSDTRSYEQVMQMRVGSLEAEQYSAGISFGMEQHFFTASDVDYDRFLHDLESFRHSTEI